MMPITRPENNDNNTSRDTRTLALAGCSIAAAAMAGAVAAPAAASPLAATSDFAHAGGSAPVPSPELLISGDTGAAVKQLQRALRLRVSGVFGKATRQAVVRFQGRHHLQGDGVVGPSTRRALKLRVRITNPSPPSANGAPGSSPAGSATATGGYSIPTSIVMCESGGSYTAVNPSTGAGGAYQILPSTWAAYGPTGLPQNASPAEQNMIAAKIYATAGRGQWSC